VPHPLLSDPWVAAKIDAAIERHGQRWTKEQVEAFREQMAETLSSHPRALRLLEVARPSAIDQSGERGVGGDIQPETGAGAAGRKAGNQ
jgi:hypothetical protein